MGRARARDTVLNGVFTDTRPHILAIVDEEIVGFLAYILDHTFSVRPCQVLMEFYVAPEHRRSAIGRALLAMAIQEAKPPTQARSTRRSLLACARRARCSICSTRPDFEQFGFMCRQEGSDMGGKGGATGGQSTNDQLVAMQQQQAAQATQANQERNARLTYGTQAIQNIFEGTPTGATPLGPVGDWQDDGGEPRNFHATDTGADPSLQSSSPRDMRPTQTLQTPPDPPRPRLPPFQVITLTLRRNSRRGASRPEPRPPATAQAAHLRTATPGSNCQTTAPAPVSTGSIDTSGNLVDSAGSLSDLGVGEDLYRRHARDFDLAVRV